MNQDPTNATARLSRGLNRRSFLKQLAVISALGAGGYGLQQARSGVSPAVPFVPGATGTTGSTLAAATKPVGQRTPGAVDGRVLVIIDLDGGNDGLSTLVPAGDGRYYDYRPELAIPDDEVLALDDAVGLSPALVNLHRRGVTTVEGVGPVEGTLSHFAMAERWQRGDVRGQTPYRTGFLGRLIDALDDGSPLVGASLFGPTPYLVSQQAAAISLEGFDPLDQFVAEEWADSRAWHDGLMAFASATGVGGAGLAAEVAGAYGELLDLAPAILGPGETDEDANGEVDWQLPMLADGGDLGRQLYLASNLLAADVGVRVVYAGLGGFDTHQNHLYDHPALMGQLDAAVDGFLGRVEAQGRGDQVLVATVSEFGRRVGENDAGLDHGAASTMLVAGPVDDLRLGERPDLGSLDEDGNLPVSVGFDRYLASLAEEWLGVEAASVLPDAPEPVGLLA